MASSISEYPGSGRRMGKSDGPIVLTVWPKFVSSVCRCSYVLTTPFICGCQASVMIRIFMGCLYVVRFLLRVFLSRVSV